MKFTQKNVILINKLVILVILLLISLAFLIPVTLIKLLFSIKIFDNPYYELALFYLIAYCMNLYATYPILNKILNNKISK